MSIIARIFSKQSLSMDSLVKQIADLSKENVLKRLQKDVFEMNFSEVRGYVRARAASPVRRQVESLLLKQGETTGQEKSELISRAIDRVVQSVVREMTRGVVCQREGSAAA